MNFKVGYIADLAVPNQVIFFSMPDFNVPGTKLQKCPISPIKKKGNF